MTAVAAAGHQMSPRRSGRGGVGPRVGGRRLRSRSRSSQLRGAGGAGWEEIRRRTRPHLGRVAALGAETTGQSADIPPVEPVELEFAPDNLPDQAVLFDLLRAGDDGFPVELIEAVLAAVEA